jgi:hypothetical protein
MITTNRKRNRKNKRARANNAYTLPVNGYTTQQRPKFTFLDPHMFITLRYAQSVTNSTLTTAANNNIFRLNSIFDPDAAVGGTQPYGYDQAAALYNRYRVLKTRYKVTFLASTGTYNAAVIPSNGALNAAPSDLTTFTGAVMNPYARYKTYNLGAPAPVFTGKHDLNVLGGVRQVEYLADDRFEAQIGANPAEVISLNIASHNPTGGTISIAFFVELWYEVDLHDPILQAAS